MRRILFFVPLVLVASGEAAAQQPPAPLPGIELFDAAPQPATWVPVTATVEIDGTAAGRFWRGSDGSTRWEYTAPDVRGITIEIRNITQQRYYVFRPASGWSSQPMVLPTQGWRPAPVARQAAGQRVSGADDALEPYARVTATGPERRLAALNFLTVQETRTDGRVWLLTDVQVREPASALWQPPPGAAVRASNIPGGIIALPSPRR